MAPTAASGSASARPAAGADAGGLAMRRWEVLRPHVQHGVPLTRAARDAGVPPRTAERWLAQFRAGGLAALGRQPRADAGRSRTQAELVEVIQGLALTRPRPSVATITRKTAALSADHGPVPQAEGRAAHVARVCERSFASLDDVCRLPWAARGRLRQVMVARLSWSDDH